MDKRNAYLFSGVLWFPFFSNARIVDYAIEKTRKRHARRIVRPRQRLLVGEWRIPEYFYGTRKSLIVKPTSRIRKKVGLSDPEFWEVHVPVKLDYSKALPVRRPPK